jgi:hypothetical protein
MAAADPAMPAPMTAILAIFLASQTGRRLTSAPRRRIVNDGARRRAQSSEYGDMERDTCTGIRKSKECGGALFKCGHCAANHSETIGCDKEGCENRKFVWIDKCVNCGRSYEKIPQYKPSAAPIGEPGSTVVGRPVSLPNVELLFGAVLGLVVLGAAIAGVMGVFNAPSPTGPAGGTTPLIEASVPAPAGPAFTEICQCYRGGMALAGEGVSVLNSRYRVGFVQCRAAFGPQGGDAWTAGWSARTEGKMVAAGCRSWLRREAR